MSPFFIALTLTDVLLLTLLVALPVRIAWWAKLLAIVVVLSFNFLAWSSADSGRGWAVRSEIPEHASFLACAIIEPDIATQTAGRIYLWEIPLAFKHGVLSYRPEGGEPRAYTVPYSRSLHEACVNASKAKQAGQAVGIRKGRTQRSGHAARGTYHAYVLPSVKLPVKGAGQ